MKLKTPKSEIPPLLKQICHALEEKKAEDLKVLGVSEQSSITDYLVLATGNSEPHLRALRVEIEKIIDQSGARILGMDTDQGSGWLVVDAFDIMVHVFTPDNRKKYALESLWKDAQEISPTTMTVVGTPKPKAKKAAKPKAPATPKPKAKAKAKPAAKAKAEVSRRKK
jgi:ribosome-associated protein